ncbi:hypothetical protein MYU51_018154, partial [Penicillium brevicompactum]
EVRTTCIGLRPAQESKGQDLRPNGHQDQEPH